VALSSDYSIKQGQIAHLDKDPRNNSVDNLAFLCMPHHDQYDSTTSQSKNLTIEEVKLYRAQLYSRNTRGSVRVESRRPHRSASRKVLLVDDQPGDILWLLHLLEERGLAIDLVTTEEAARKTLDAVASGEKIYELAILDIMVPTKDILELVDLDQDFYESSLDAGVRLCHHARQELGLTAEILPIVSISARNDEHLIRRLEKFGVPLFSRRPRDTSESLRDFIVEFTSGTKQEVES
jgi:CheY-like chemotaxis protein